MDYNRGASLHRVTTLLTPVFIVHISVCLHLRNHITITNIFMLIRDIRYCLPIPTREPTLQRN